MPRHIETQTYLDIAQTTARLHLCSEALYMAAHPLLLSKLYEMHTDRQVHEPKTDALVDDIASLQPGGQAVVLLLPRIRRRVARAPAQE